MSKTNAKTIRVKRRLGQHPTRPSRSLWTSKAMSKVEFAQLLVKACRGGLTNYHGIDLVERVIYLDGQMYCYGPPGSPEARLAAYYRRGK